MDMNIMIVDDNKIDLFVGQKIIEKVSAGSNIRTFTSANAAIVFLKILEGKDVYPTMFTPDIILLDINMPEMDGFQFLDEFNKLTRINKTKIKIYMLTSSTNSQDIKKAQNQNSCVGFLNKPLTTNNFEKIAVEFRPYLNRFDAEAEDVSLFSDRVRLQ